MDIIQEFVLSMLASIAFSILFNAPRKELLFCGFTGALGWLVYHLSIKNGFPAPLSSLFATVVLSIFARGLAVNHQMPVTVYLLPGIFPLVPGSGVYYSAYYLFIGSGSLSSQHALNTFLIAGAIVLGIVFSFSIPQNLFHKFFRKAER